MGNVMMTNSLMGFWVLLALLTAGGESAPAASQLKPIHLKGITGVNVVVFVDREVEGFMSVETKLLERVNTILAAGSLSSGSRIDLTLSVEAMLYPLDAVKTPNVSLLGLQVLLREPVQLRRNPKLKIPGGNGAITWSRKWATLEPTADLPSAIEREVVSLVEDFVADVASAKK